MNPSPRITDPTRVHSLIASVKHWYHQIELAPGIITPGINNSSECLTNLNAIGLPQDCLSLRVLDIGCRDGFYAFEMERRGAEVIAVDYAPPEKTGFLVASCILGSRVTYIVENVYNLLAEKYGVFDIVLFLGVLYHLRNPVLALDQIRKVTKPNGLLFVETLLTNDNLLNSLNIPVWQFFPRNAANNDETNKWGPNLEGLKAAIDEAQFEVLASLVYGDRSCIKAQAVVDSRREYFRQLDSSVAIWSPRSFPDKNGSTKSR